MEGREISLAYLYTLSQCPKKHTNNLQYMQERLMYTLHISKTHDTYDQYKMRFMGACASLEMGG